MYMTTYQILMEFCGVSTTYYVLMELGVVFVTESGLHHCGHSLCPPAPHALVWVLTHLEVQRSKVREFTRLNIRALFTFTTGI